MGDIAVASLEPKKFIGDDGTIIRLYDDLIACGDEQHKLDGVHASVENGSALESRVTLTRMLAVGLLAFAFKKKSGGEKYLTVKGPDFAWVALANRKHISNAMRFATAINDSARKNATAKQIMPKSNLHKPESMPQRHISKGDIYDMTALNEDFEAGRISLAEFLAKKKELGF